MSEPKRPPRWTIPFLRALERTGEVRAAAEDTGIDHSTAYARRRAHGEFAVGWDEALRGFEAARVAREAVAALARDPSTIHSSVNGPPPRAELREELVGGSAQAKRAGHDRWSQAKEKLFFDELAATANVRRAADAAGVSTNAVYARRIKHPLFRAKWDAVLETGRAAIEMKLVEAANKAFDPDEIDVEGVEPRVSVAEAIRIVQIHGSKAQRGPVPDPFAAGSSSAPGDDIDEVRERLIKKLLRLRRRERSRALGEGWSLDESTDLLIPPGYVKAADYGAGES